MDKLEIDRQRVILEVPEAWFSNPVDGDRHRLFYSSLLAALAELGLLIDPVWLPRGSERTPRPKGRHDFTISFHSHGPAATNILRCKESYIPPFYSMDPMGYACFSQLAIHPELYQPAVERQNLTRATAFREELAQDLRNCNLSKYPQPNCIGKDKAGYIFVPLQMSNDSVAKGGWLDSLKALRTIIETASARGLGTVLKRHPRCKSVHMARLLAELSKDADVTVSIASIHDLIAGADLVVGANSGVLFEALIQAKPVVSYAASDFASAIQQVRNHEELAHAIVSPSVPSAAWRDRFLFWYLTEYCVRADDVPAIRDRIAEAIKGATLDPWPNDGIRPTYIWRLYLSALIDRAKRRLF